MSVFESTSIDKNFDSVIEDLNKLKEITINNYIKLEESTELSKIQRLQPLRIESFSVRLAEKKDCWNYKPVLRVEWNGYDTDKYIKENGLAKGIRFEENYHYVYIYFDETNSESLDSLIEFVKMIAESEKNIHEENIEKAKVNRSTEKKVFDILKQIGINETYYGYKTSRSRDTSKMYYAFPSEIKKQIPTYYSDSKLEDLCKSIIDKVKNIWNDEVNKMKKQRLEKEKQEKEKESNKKLALLLAKYDLDLTDSWNELLDKIIEKNKYLRLAHYLEENRNDWTDGFSFAEAGLRNFSVENEVDQDIIDNIESHMYEDWDGDGRVFRDCKYNYSIIYGMAAEQDPQLYKDYEIVKEEVEHF
ncbi:hypothetical protein NV379_02025 [Paenibacillus sp. N1-5-1-14]|uniref:hypothetical protein n=1 Tax=Paenibacillus radicibacter TaxID=2972488 RepID=UPI00215901E7|nr:hypothetical protein [Paenibacillus radicibacter]MCR8641423.1 hypothetical protein [Paenibacillus radicibacter]